jgi:glycosyltransferase involved in cell wall biosynthesis
MSHISVTIPTFNRAHLIGPTIESVLSQSYHDWDLLVVDDASADDTAEVVSQYSQTDERIRFIQNDKNLGLTRNWNKCIYEARGPYVQVLLSDDLMDDSYLARVAEIFQAHPGIGFIAASCRYIDSSGSVIGEGSDTPARLLPPGDEAVESLLDNGYPHVSSIVMRKACLEEIGTFREDIWHGPDVEMDARLAARFGFYHCGQVFTSFRRHGSNMGALEYLREDFLDADTLKKRLSLSYLSEAAIQRRGIVDLEAHLARGTAEAALSGATIMMGYGRPALSRLYLRKAIRATRSTLVMRQFWKALALNIVQPLGIAVMRRRMRISPSDLEQANRVEASLKRVGKQQAP